MVSYIFGFDIDGALTNFPKKIPNPILISFIISQLKSKQPVGIITGRTMHWVKKEILNHIEIKIKDKSNLDYLFVSCEKATIKMIYIGGKSKTIINSRVKPPISLINRMKQLTEKSMGVFFDEKINIPSIEILGGTLKQIEKQKDTLKNLKRKIREILLIDYPDYIIGDEGVIALDLQHKMVNKVNAADEFIKFILSKKIKDPKIIFFGDTISDFNLVQKIWELGIQISLAYVGIKDIPKSKFRVIRPNNKELYDLGTIAILKDLGMN